MTPEQADEAITRAFTTQWPVLQPAVPLVTPNEIGELPTDPPATATRFAALEIISTPGEQLTMGGPGSRLVGRNGWIQVKLWVPSGERTEGMHALYASVREIFEMTNIAGPDPTDETIDTGTSYDQPGGNDGRWCLTLVRTPFTYYETK